MKNPKHRSFLLVLCAAAILAGCAAGGEESTLPSATTEPTQMTEFSTAPDTQPPTDPPAAIFVNRNPLTGEEMEVSHDTRIFAVTINNVPAALPHINADRADMVFEMFIDNYVTRGLALFSDIRKVETIGSVRSLRYNFTDIGIAYDALIGHAGGSQQVIRDANRSGLDHFNTDTPNATSYSFRDKTRKQEGHAWEHTLMVKGPGLYEEAQRRGYRVTQEPGKEYGLHFVKNGTPEAGDEAHIIDLKFKLEGHSKKTRLTYDEQSGRYVFTQYGKTIDDVKPEDYELFTNVFILLADVKTDKDGYHIADLLGSGEGYYACGGKLLPIRWHHEEAEDPFTFTIAEGVPLMQQIGNSYLAIAPRASDVSWESAH